LKLEIPAFSLMDERHFMPNCPSCCIQGWLLSVITRLSSSSTNDSSWLGYVSRPLSPRVVNKHADDGRLFMAHSDDGRDVVTFFDVQAPKFGKTFRREVPLF